MENTQGGQENQTRPHFLDVVMARMGMEAKSVMDEVPELASIAVVVTWQGLPNAQLPFGLVADRLEKMTGANILAGIRQTTRLLEHQTELYEGKVVGLVRYGERLASEVKQLEQQRDGSAENGSASRETG